MGPQQCCVSHRINTCDLSIQVTVFKSLLIGKASVISWDVFHLWWRPSVIFYCSNESFFLFFFIYILLAWAGTWSHCDHSMNLYDAGFCGKMTTGNPGTSSERKRKMEKLTHFLKLLKSKWKSNQIIFVSIFTYMLNFDLLKNIKTTIVNFIAMYVHTYVAKFFLRQSFKLSKIIK